MAVFVSVGNVITFTLFLNVNHLPQYVHVGRKQSQGEINPCLGHNNVGVRVVLNFLEIFVNEFFECEFERNCGNLT